MRRMTWATWLTIAQLWVPSIRAETDPGTISFVQRYEALTLPTDGRTWVLSKGEANNVPLVEYILQGQSTRAWTSLLTLQYIPGEFTTSKIGQLVHSIRAELERGCPGLKWSDGLAGSNFVQYEWRHYGCNGFPAQHELAKILKGKHGIFIVHYVEKALQLNPEVRIRWLFNFDRAVVSEFK